MKIDPAVIINRRMKSALREKHNWHQRVEVELKSLDRIEKSYSWHVKRKQWPEPTDVGNDGDNQTNKEPHYTLEGIRYLEWTLYCAIENIRGNKGPSEPAPIPTSWKEFDNLKMHLTHLLKKLDNETNKVRKKFVTQMIDVYLKDFSMKSADQIKELKLKKVKELKEVKEDETKKYRIINLEYDYKQKCIVGVNSKGEKFPATTLTRK